MSNERKPFLKSAGLVAAITMFSRVLGLLRDIVLASCLGAGRIADIFWIAFELPNLARRVLGEGSLSAFIVPIYGEEREKNGQQAAWQFAGNCLTVMTLITLCLTAAGIIFAKPLFTIMSYGYTQRMDVEAVALGIRLTRIMFPFLMLLAVSSILMGLCHSHRHFAAPAFGSVMLNLAMIAAGVLFFKLPDTVFAQALAIAVLIGGLLRLIIMLPVLHREGFRYRFQFAPGSERMQQLFLMMLPALFGLAVVQINITVSRSFATIIDEGLVPCLVFSNRLVQLPLAIIASALATAILPGLSKLWSEKNFDDLRDLVLYAFRIILILFIPATVGLMVLGHPIIQALFQRGQWTAQATSDTYFALLFYAPGLALWGLLRILLPIFYAKKDVKTPVLVATVAMVLNVGLNLVLIFTPFLRDNLRHGGLALASTLSVALQTLALIWILDHRFALRLWDRQLFQTAWRTTLAALCMGGFCYGFWHYLQPIIYRTTTLTLPLLALVIATASALYFLIAYTLKTPDLKNALDILRRKKK